jgi:hypothetical protein
MEQVITRNKNLKEEALYVKEEDNHSVGDPGVVLIGFLWKCPNGPL